MKTSAVFIAVIAAFTIYAGLIFSPEQAQRGHVEPLKMQRQVIMLSDDDSKASGIIFKRHDRFGEPRTFVWTAAHFAKDIKGDVYGRQDIIKGRRVCGHLESRLRLIKIVPKIDIALLEVLNTDAFDWSATFDLSGRVPPLGYELSHVGSWMGNAGHQSYSEGIVSYSVREVQDLWGMVPMMQSSLIAFPGSSGGPVFDRHNGKVVGMLLGMTWPAVTYFLPMEQWAKEAKENNLYWALNPDVPMPDFVEKKLDK